MTVDEITRYMTQHWPPSDQWTPSLRTGYEAIRQTVEDNLAYYQRAYRCLASVEGERCLLLDGHYGRHDYEMVMER